MKNRAPFISQTVFIQCKLNKYKKKIQIHTSPIKQIEVIKLSNIIKTFGV